MADRTQWVHLSTAFANVERHEASPALPESGIAVVVEYDRNGLVWLRGAIRLSIASLGEAARPLRHLTLVARPERDHHPVTVMPFREQVLTTGDDDDSGGRVVGWFNLSLREVLGRHAERGSWVCLVTLGPVLSNTVIASLPLGSNES
jgi:hypothetical protein